MTPLEIASKKKMFCQNCGGFLSEEEQAIVTAEVIRQDEEIKKLKSTVRAVGVACLTGDHDLVSGFACPICFAEQSAALKAAKSLFRDIRKQGWEWSDEAAEYLKECGDQ